jgi:hypothetical protein
VARSIAILILLSHGAGPTRRSAQPQPCRSPPQLKKSWSNQAGAPISVAEVRGCDDAPRIPFFTIRIETDMARKKPVGNAEFISFDVLYEDGARSSNRRVPSEILGGLDGDEPAKELIEEQDRKIAELSGRPRGPIKAIMRSGK